MKVPGFRGDVGGYAKINAAFSWGGPDLAAEVVTNLTHVKINHIAIMDWNGLKGLTDALGGVRVYIRRRSPTTRNTSPGTRVGRR